MPPAAAASAHVAGTAGSGHPTLRPLNCSSETVRKPPALQRVPDAERLGCCPHRTRQTHPHTTQHESLTLGIRGLETHLRRSWPTSAVQHGSCRERRVWHKSGNSGITRHQIATPDHVTPVPHCSPRCCRLCVMGRAWFQTCPRLWKVTWKPLSLMSAGGDVRCSGQTLHTEYRAGLPSACGTNDSLLKGLVALLASAPPAH